MQLQRAERPIVVFRGRAYAAAQLPLWPLVVWRTRILVGIARSAIRGSVMARTKRAYLRAVWDGKMCALCGGLRKAESAEHAPPTVLFHGKSRPRGLEVPACERCNSGSSVFDQLVTMVAMSSDPEAIINPRALSDYQLKIIAGTAHNAHLVTKGGSPFIYHSSGPISVLDHDGSPTHTARAVELDSLVSEGIARWAAKQTLALWYIHTKMIASHRSTINVDILTNAAKPDARFEAMIAAMGSEMSLGVGAKAKHDEFSYRIVTYPERGIGVVFAQYHGGMAFISVLNDSKSSKLSRRGLTFRFGTNAQKGIYLLRG